MASWKIAACVPLLMACPAPALAQSTVTPAASVPQLFVAANSFPSGEELRAAAPIGGAATWLTPADTPASVIADARGRTAGPNSQIVLAQIGIKLVINPDDSIAECQGVYGDAYLAPDICVLIRKRGKFRHALGFDGKPVEGSITMTFQYSLSEPGGYLGLPPHPGPPPNQWPVLRQSGNVRLVGAPQPDGPVSQSRPTEIGVFLEFQEGRVSHCQVIHREGDSALEAPTCAYLTSASFEIDNPGGFGSLPMIVQWRDGRPSPVPPVHTVSQMARPASEDGQLVRGLPGAASLSKDAAVYLQVGASGQVTECRIAESAGNDAADIAMCRHMLRSRFRPAEDVFGRPIEGRAWIRVRFE